MKTLIKRLLFLSTISLFFELWLCDKIKLFTSNGRTAGVVEIQNVRSLLTCSVVFQQNVQYFSFNYHKADQICELSTFYPENSTAEVGWSVYAYIADGSWGNWMNWSSCSVTCGNGTRSRSRLCDNPSPSNGGVQCQGPNVETKACSNGSCFEIVDGSWGNWMNWSSCSVTCGNGTRSRSRLCDNPSPSNGGAQCQGSNVENQACNNGSCLDLVDGSWGNWMNWSTCSVTCANGTRSRSRLCDNPSPSNGGAQCQGSNVENDTCNNGSCLDLVDGSWGNWIDWSSCSVTCGNGTRSRSRSCDSPAPSNGGTQCQGSNVETHACNNGSCLPFVNGFYLSADYVQWTTAKNICEGASARLVIIDTQLKMDNLLTVNFNQGFNHWIGMTCNFGADCHWIDGSRADSGFQYWAPREPNDENCVWMGYFTNKWDDTMCNDYKMYICEQI